MPNDIEIEKLEYAKLYKPEPYFGCPACGSRKWGAINPTTKDEMIYRCHGRCGTLFRLNDEQIPEREGIKVQGRFENDDS